MYLVFREPVEFQSSVLYNQYEQFQLAYGYGQESVTLTVVFVRVNTC